MKKNILELAKQAKLKFSSEESLSPAEEKFAELIVRECAKVAFDDWCEGTNESSSEMAILKHFGVEE